MNRSVFAVVCSSLCISLVACTQQTNNPITSPAQPSSVTTSPASHASSVTSQASSESLIEDDVPDISSLPVEERLLSGGILEIGNVKAKHILTLFTNHACEYCQEFHHNLLPHLIKEYVSTGKLRIHIVPFSIQKFANSDYAAATMICAAQQGKGQAMNNLLFSAVEAKNLRKSITDLRMDFKILEGCANGQWIREQLKSQKQLAAQSNVTLVPTYLLENQTFTGLPEWSDLRGQVQEILK